MKNFGSNLFPRKQFFNDKKIFDQKILDEKFWFKHIPEEMILQP